ncbi:hypothetical protein SAMN04487949_2525 [Halogranum gelatinilyticum]|uniref:SipW-cognate class signal peptide n=1 Tax=Halogranum gelatinilyticum TaxID=660521 RepID=A0A1G9VWG2_9EURY|nr:hypothetical protein [Halogranum gelatinilyticum]SDM76227.1 hypothetical protein SAMN04487949_2525 [Halogranum gelatinilyticum]
MTHDITPSRRQLLAGLGGFSLLYGGTAVGRATFGFEPVELTSQQTHQVDGGLDLRVGWRETYNGAVRAETTETTGDATDGPVVALDNALPGDHGSLTVLAELVGDTARTARLSLALDLTDTAENGRTEPEVTAGDDTPDDGELAESIDVSLRYDTGILGVDAAGGQNGIHDLTEPLVAPDAEGTLAEVAAALADGVALAPDAGDGQPCLEAGTTIPLTMTWAIDEDVGNVVQGDSATFSLDVFAEECLAEDNA